MAGPRRRTGHFTKRHAIEVHLKRTETKCNQRNFFLFFRCLPLTSRACHLYDLFMLKKKSKSEAASLGGLARAKKLSKKRRAAIAKRAAEARWGKKK